MLNTFRTAQPFWQTAFRPFFLLGSLFSILLIGTWGLFLSGLIRFSPYGGPIAWHSHEILFGFTLAIAVGFLLTAVQNWTGELSAKGRPLKVMVAIWLLARVLWLWADAPFLLIMCLDIAFPLYGAHWLARPMLKVTPKSKQKHNWPFVLVLLALAVMQGVYHGLLHLAPEYIFRLNHAVVLIMANLVLWIGGRVLPFFVENRLHIKRRALPIWLTPIAMFLSWSLIPLTLAQSEWLLIACALLAACAHVVRLLFFWRNKVLTEPLLWSLFLASSWVIIGIGSMALQYSEWIHVITVAGLGGMILSIMSRVSLGHTGEMIRTLKFMPVAFLFLSIAALARISVSLVSDLSINPYALSSVLWIGAFGIFMLHYATRLTQIRRDGLPR